MTKPVAFASFLTATISSLAPAQDKVFRAWFEAPQTVMAGESFQVWMWASYEENGLPATSGYMNGVGASIEVSGNLGAFASISQLQDGLQLMMNRGTPDGPWLRDFIVGQADVPGVTIDDRNPLPILMFEIETRAGAAGLLHVDLRSLTNESVPYLVWYYPDVGSDNWPNTSDPGVSLITTTATIHVIPSPASAALLCHATLILARRRRC
jgi:hypothetical protein